MENGQGLPYLTADTETEINFELAEDDVAARAARTAHPGDPPPF